MKTVSHERLLEALSYNKETGVFRWKISICNVRCGDAAGNFSGIYPTIQLDGYRTRAHRWALFYVYGEWPSNEVDHIDGNPLNNRIDNLRDVTRSVNAKNIRLSSRNTSGVSGVVYHKPSSRWKAEIKKSGRSICLGYFRDWFDAVCRRKSAEKLMGFHPNHGRLPRPINEPDLVA